jgi:hypothetical protein
VETERLEKYEAWVHTLESRQRELSSGRGMHVRLFLGFFVVSFAGFAFNRWIGIASVLTGMMCCAFGFYVVGVRANDYARELKVTRRELQQLASASSAVPGRSDDTSRGDEGLR